MVTKPQAPCKKVVTQQDIADRLGVSRELVAHALNKTHRTRISAEMRHKVEQLAREMNYKPRRLTTHNIGYLLPTSGTYLEAEHALAIHVEGMARAAGYRLILIGMKEVAELDSLSEALNPKTVDGVISPRWYSGKIRHALSPDIPLVVVADEDNISPDVDVVSIDAHATIKNMAQYLIDRGHRQIGLAMSAVDTVKQHRDIVRGARDALRANGLPVDNLTFARGSTEEVAASLKTLLAQPQMPTAWITSTSAYALAIAFGLNYHGKRIPEDVSVMSFLDSRQFNALPTSLTSTTAFGAELAQMAVARLIEKIEGTSSEAQHQLVAARIIERASVGTL